MEFKIWTRGVNNFHSAKVPMMLKRTIAGMPSAGRQHTTERTLTMCVQYDSSHVLMHPLLSVFVRALAVDTSNTPDFLKVVLSKCNSVYLHCVKCLWEMFLHSTNIHIFLSYTVYDMGYLYLYGIYTAEDT